MNSMVEIVHEDYLKNLGRVATSQVTSGGITIPYIVRNYICGLTSLYMAVKLLAVDTGFKYPKFSDFVRCGLNQTNITCTYGYLETKFGEEIIKIPIYYSSKETEDQILSKSIQIINDILIDNSKTGTQVVKIEKTKPHSKRIRGFSISTGWDTGGTSKLLERMGLEKWIATSVKSKFMPEFQNASEDFKLQVLKNSLVYSLKNNISKDGKFKAVTCVSINTGTEQWKKYYRDYMPNNKYINHTVKTHVVLAVCIINDEIIFMDPAGKDKKEIIQKMDLEDFLCSYNGIHTQLQIKSSTYKKPHADK